MHDHLKKRKKKKPAAQTANIFFWTLLPARTLSAQRTRIVKDVEILNQWHACDRKTFNSPRGCHLFRCCSIFDAPTGPGSLWTIPSLFGKKGWPQERKWKSVSSSPHPKKKKKKKKKPFHPFLLLRRLPYNLTKKVNSPQPPYGTLRTLQHHCDGQKCVSHSKFSICTKRTSKKKEKKREEKPPPSFPNVFAQKSALSDKKKEKPP